MSRLCELYGIYLKIDIRAEEVDDRRNRFNQPATYKYSRIVIRFRGRVSWFASYRGSSRIVAQLNIGH